VSELPSAAAQSLSAAVGEEGLFITPEKPWDLKHCTPSVILGGCTGFLRSGVCDSPQHRSRNVYVWHRVAYGKGRGGKGPFVS